MRFRISVVAILFLSPLVFLSGVGGYHLWKTGWSFVASFSMIACYCLAYGLAWFWTRRKSKGVLPNAGPTEPLAYWTDRDKAAWALVEQTANAVTRISVEEATDARKYAADAQDLALIVTRVYRPAAADPFRHLTLPELLTCAELVAQDLAALVDTYVPGSHLIRTGDLGRVQQAADWYFKARNAYWLASAVFDPIRTGFQVAATKIGLTTPWQKLRENVLLWFYTAYLRELGRYLIELNSGRLKVGAARYRELMGTARGPDAGRSEPERSTITLAIIGQVKAGKSSLINAILGDQKAVADVLPATDGVSRYELRDPTTLDLLDTPGYDQGGPNDKEATAATAAAESADLILLVAPARSAARSADLIGLDRLASSFAKKPHLRLPPVVLVLTHIDLLTPATEWAPPYDWQGMRPKEQAVRDARAA
ncbi:MAG TPA: GTPase domain-containing protein, partial [Fimbriiglobus sp.]